VTPLPIDVGHASAQMVWTGAWLALAIASLIAAERSVFAYNRWKRQRIRQTYGPIAQRALGGDPAAVDVLVNSPRRVRVAVAWLLINPLVQDRDPDRIARTRVIVDSMGLAPVAMRLLRSRWWWRRVLALRAVGVLQLRQQTAEVVAALDDPDVKVRAAALDAIADVRDPASRFALIVRLSDESLPHGRVAAALSAFGISCEPFILDLAEIDAANRLSYARALRICGTAESRPILCRWTQDPRADVRAAAFDALARVGLDASSARLAIQGLESEEIEVRTRAAYALRGWHGPGDAVPQLARHLDDAWPVAVQAARSLQTVRPSGVAALQAAASRSDLAGVLARQLLWEIADRC
jgi:HEAT repeat protein